MCSECVFLYTLTLTHAKECWARVQQEQPNDDDEVLIYLSARMIDRACDKYLYKAKVKAKKLPAIYKLLH